MSKTKLSALPRHNLLWGVLGLVVAVGLGWKMTADYFTARVADAASPHGALSASATPKPPVEVSGFRSARFGDDETAVRAAIVKDFGAKDDQIREAVSAVQKTKLLAVRVKNVVADSGVAEVVYIFGYASNRLMQVNVVWNSQFAANMNPAQIGVTANVLGNYFANQGFVPTSVTLNQKLPNGAVRVFDGRDKDNHLVTLIFREAVVKEAATTQPDDKSKDAKAGKDKAKTKRIALLRLSYVENSNNPDVFKITEGNF